MKGLKPGAPAVLLQHGIADNAFCFVVHHHQEAPAFVLAREGYDVWLANGRGTLPSRNHTRFDADSRITKQREAYWDWSWPELGDYDNPAFVDLVREVSGQAKITYIGHGQGATQMFHSLTSKKQLWYKDRLDLFVALAPVTQLSHESSTFYSLLVNYRSWIKWFNDTFSIYSVPGYWGQVALRVLCGTHADWCLWLEGYLLNTHTAYDDLDRFQVYLGHYPTETSWKSLYHYA